MKTLLRTSILLWAFLLFSTGAVLAKDPSPPPKTPELLAQGKKLFEQSCEPCHGAKGDGKGPAGAALKPAPTDFSKPLKEWPNTKRDLQKVFGVISNGIPNSAMIKWDLPEKDRWALAYTLMGFAASSKTTPRKK